MQQLCYISTSNQEVNNNILTDILTNARDNYLKYDITGMLLFACNTFIQLIEGPKENIDHL